ncbi:hypothetical protein ABW20_dc0102710 [Dactylellina cionopaga]|nr:hypothetical protein ABW20_dc0102710 [Dactylellina cionopaga]
MQFRVAHLLSLLVSATLAYAQTTATTPSLDANAITAPIRGDVITAGEPFTIKWTKPQGASVTLVLVDGPANSVVPVATIVASVPNSGAYTWSVPKNLPASTTYAIRISYNNNPQDYNYSDRFVFESDVTASSSAATSAASSSSAAETTSAETTETTEAATTTEASSTPTSAVSTIVTSAGTNLTTRAPTTDTTSTRASRTTSAVTTNQAPLDGNSAATRFSSGSFSGLVVAFAAVMLGGAVVVV